MENNNNGGFFMLTEDPIEDLNTENTEAARLEAEFRDTYGFFPDASF